MISKEANALNLFRSGYNCSQAVLSSYSDKLGLNSNIALDISSGFGGGMGRLQETCGTVTGSYMVIGLFNGKKFSDNADKKEASYSMIRKFSEKFKSFHGATDCRSLLKCDLTTEEGQKYAMENNLYGTICESCISDSIRIIEEMINE